jgi:predicted nucleic acid-binding protein
MTPVFVDTMAFVAIYNKNEQFHVQAVYYEVLIK